MMDFNERVIPGITANFLYQEALARYAFAYRKMRRGKSVLDIPCGTGYGSAYLSQKEYVTGIDRNKEAIKFAKKHYHLPKFFVGDAFETGFDDNSFDYICCFESIEHFKNADKFLKEAKRMMTKSGKFFISTPSADLSNNGEMRSPYHVKEYGVEGFRKLLKKHFKNVEIFGQDKSVKAKEALAHFMDSQDFRQGLVNKDKFGFRKLLPKAYKEKVWKYAGNFVGRNAQNGLTIKDFPISKLKTKAPEYIVAICQG